ncbi:peptidoglycan-binding protein [Streptomyces sp. NPDC059783]|uniref:peptidoglycan-binding protein n=1 Tax=Streptomyces sp. NPDC059783 TaxID=3346944 RepID=UPI00365B5A60
MTAPTASRRTERAPGRPSEGEGPEDAASWLSRRRRWVAVLAAGAVALAGAGVAAAAFVKSPAQAAADAEPPAPSVLTAEVEYRVLASTVITRGQVIAGQSVRIAPQTAGGEGAGSPVVTKIGVPAGGKVTAGKVLLEVSGRPVFALPGKLPVYRDLKPGATGDDVAQLQKALSGLGHSTGADARGTFGEGTKAALTAFYASIGYDPLPALDDHGAGLRAARDAVTAAERAVQDIEDANASADAARSGTSDGSPDGTANEKTSGDAGTTDAKSTDPTGTSTGTAKGSGAPAPGRQLARAREDLAAARTALAAARAADGPELPAGEVVFLQGFPARVDSVSGRVGTQVSGTVMTVSAGRLVVHAYLQEHQTGLVRKGLRAQVLSELTGIRAGARVTSLSGTLSTAGQDAGADAPSGGNQQGSGQGGGEAPVGESGYLLEVRPDRPLDPRLAGQDVRLTIEAATTDGKALVVPVTAITAGADGRTTVTVLTGSGARRQVAVEPGTVGDGFVAVTPVGSGALRPGDKVVTGVRRTTDTGAGQ